MAKLEVDKISTYNGSIRSLKGISLSVRDGEIVTLIGGNGAGKTTTLKTISGVLRPRDGNITLDGRPIQRLEAHEIVRLGICQAPEGRRIFRRMTVRENLEMGAFARRDAAGIQEDTDKVFKLFPRLQERVNQKGGTLSGGEQQMLAIGRALMASPKILLLDEPSMGLAPVLVEAIFKTIAEINRLGTTVLLVEQNALMALSIAHRGYVLETGSIVLSDTAANLQRNEKVQKAYLGIE